MARRPTLADVAREAGVSSATVDRVLNGREAVRPDTALRVSVAAQRLGYHAAPLMAGRAQTNLPRMRFGFVLQKERQAFYQAFRAEITRAVTSAPGIRGQVEFAFSTSQSPTECAALLDDMRGRVDVVAATAVAHPATTDAVSRLNAAGIPCVALLNDFAQGVRQHYVGLNNIKVGRIAAHIIAQTARTNGKIALFVGGYRWHGHELRETGFRSYFREHAPQFTLLDTLVNLETRPLTYEATLDLLQRHPDLVGIYCAGGGMEGAIAALHEARSPGTVALVVNELTPESRAALIAREITMVISTPLPRLCADVVGLMRGYVEDGMPTLSGQHFIQPDLYLPESV